MDKPKHLYFKKMGDRVEVRLTFSADLDMVPGWGHNGQDWVEFVKQTLPQTVGHYNVQVEVESARILHKDGTYEPETAETGPETDSAFRGAIAEMASRVWRR